MAKNARAEFFAVASSYLSNLAPLAPTILQTGAAVADALYKAERDAEHKLLPSAADKPRKAK